MVVNCNRLEAGLSVVICCYNSERRIRATLKYLAAQKNVDFPLEIILVNNASTDATVETANSEWNSLKDPYCLRIVDEPLPGLMNARIAGVAAAKYEYLVFCDDDNYLCESYLSSVFRYFTEHPKVGAIGGEGKVTSDVEIPEWFPYFSNFYACFPQTNARLLYGAGLSVRTGVLRYILSKKPSFYLVGRAGSGLMGGDDHELCYLIKWTGVDIAYVPELHFLHYMPSSRLDLDYLKRILYGSGLSSPRLWAFEDSPLLVTCVYRIFRVLLGFPKSFIKFLTRPKMLLVKVRMHAAFTAGVFRGGIGEIEDLKKIKLASERLKIQLAEYSTTSGCGE